MKSYAKDAIVQVAQGVNDGQTMLGFLDRVDGYQTKAYGYSIDACVTCSPSLTSNATYRDLLCLQDHRGEHVLFPDADE